MRASIITVCFNSENTIRKTIESVLNQTVSDFEYIIIDGASSDNTLNIANAYKSAFECRGIPYRVYSEKDHGIYDAMDKGIGKAKGEIIGIVNSDDWYEATAVQTVLGIYDRHPFDICMCSLYLWRGEKKVVKEPKIRRFKTSRDLCHPSMFVTRETYKRVGVYSRKLFYGDFDFWLRCFRKGAAVILSKKVVTNYTMGGVSNEKDIKKMLMRIKDRCKVYRRNGYSKLYYFEAVFMEVAKLILA